jgi:hypothetical protein
MTAFEASMEELPGNQNYHTGIRSSLADYQCLKI